MASNKRYYIQKIALTCASCIAVSTSLPAFAQENSPNASTDSSESSSEVSQNEATNTPAATASPAEGEIIVQARRRNERLQEVPVAVSFIGGDDLEERAIVRLEDIARTVPALQISSESYGRNVPSFTIRSQRQATNHVTQDTSVALYFADVPQARAQGLNAAMYDLSSIQVLKGPQGTLFGRNTTGGAVIITPRAPADILEGYLTGTVGNLDKRSLEGALNIPVTDTLQVRVAGQINRRDGYLLNVFDGSDLENERTESWRVSVRFRPTDFLENRLVVNGFHADEHGSGGVLRNIGAVAIPAIATALATEFAAAQNRGRYTTNSNDPHRTRMESLNVSNITEISIGEVTLKNVFGFRHLESLIRLDHDASPVTILGGRDDMTVNQYSDEIQVLGRAFDNRLDYIVGYFYFEENGSANAGNNIFGNPRNLTGRATNISNSIFGQLTYRLPFLEGASLTAGARQTWDKRRFLYTSTQGVVPTCFFTVNDVPVASGGVRLNPCLLERAASFDNLTYTLTADWRVSPGVLLYAAHRKGYRAGGFNQRATSIAATQPFNPEEVLDYELGLKTTWHLGGATGIFNVAAYHQDYSQIQRNQSRVDANGTFIGSTVTNAANATVDGIEFEATFRPIRGLELGAFYSYSRARYQAWLVPQLRPTGIVFIDQSDSPFAAAPEHSGGASISYTFPVGSDDGDITLSGNIYKQSVTYGSDGNYTPALRSTARLPGFTLVNARVEWADILGSKISAAIFVQNLTDEFYYTSGVDVSQAGLGTNFGAIAAPRTYGLQATFRF